MVKHGDQAAIRRGCDALFMPSAFTPFWDMAREEAAVLDPVSRRPTRPGVGKAGLTVEKRPADGHDYRRLPLGRRANTRLDRLSGSDRRGLNEHDPTDGKRAQFVRTRDSPATLRTGDE